MAEGTTGTTAAIEPFNPQKAMDAVRVRIQTEFAALIPEAQWREMVQREVDEFFKDRPGENHYTNYPRRPSKFSEIVHEELAKWSREKVLAILTSPEWQAQWDDKFGNMPSEEIRKLLVEHAPVIIQRALGVAFQGAFLNAMNEMRNGQAILPRY